ncbi:hypothetical protein FHR81_003278 [Actinoalloteichus hoggarensis]|uniref:Uncharacterized protein n=1 Tax=Actinoalloteichus hoggarensis TaxID=1470176 RepID=A0A221W7G1_9PSEU|nr:polymorphic toxin-type HINT domain-containing protein [Actinoalloteichus hoggarensis]ASO21633.1 hypothetical protein AHOG_20075 [Actinoalloteichus hoggarensis]MBB5922226.1 hypothetical protein [Actinoalloteichus hoggarensis]
MADGTSTAIEDVRLGDEVLATDPTTGESGPRRVTALIVGDGVKDLVEIDIVSGGDGSAVGSVVATDGHPFWAANLDRWVDASDLEPGHEFETADHRPAEVGGTRTWTQVRRVYNLTVDGLHTYYVETGDTPVLVHNCGEASDDLLDFADEALMV